MTDKNGPRDNSGVFVVKGRTYTTEEVLQAAEYRGELQPCWEELLASLSCAQTAKERNLEPSMAALQTMSEGFRYDRDLVTAEETERWLTERGLSLVDFDKFFVRRYWRTELENPPEVEPVDRLTARPELQSLLLADLTMSGEFFQMAARLARRAAALQAEPPDGSPDPATLEAERAHFLEQRGIGAEDLSGWLARRGISPSIFDHLLKIEAAYRKRCAVLLSPRARDRVLQALRLPLTRIQVERMEVDSMDAAREAQLCVREDGMELASLAQECRYPYRKTEVLLDDLGEELQKNFLTAAPGQVLNPIQDGERFLVCRLLGKTDPTLSDEKVARRVDTQILDAHFAELSAQEVRWLIQNESAA